MTLPLQPNLLGLPLAPAQWVVDPLIEQQTQTLAIQCISENCTADDSVLPTYLKQYQQWIKKSKNNKITGMDSFDTVDYANGTSEGFDQFYNKNNQRKFRCFRGEYLYHQLVWDRNFSDWQFLDDAPLEKNDAVVISVPFADTGDLHLGCTQVLLDQCLLLNIPVLIDCAFFGICGNIEFDLSHPAITDVCFSLSKSFPVSNLRIGMRLSRSSQPDGLTIYNQTQYVNRFGAALGIKLFDLQGPDDVFDRYRNKQISWCNKHNLRISNTVIFGIDFNNQYPQYNRGSPNSNRICFAKHYQYDTLLERL